MQNTINPPAYHVCKSSRLYITSVIAVIGLLIYMSPWIDRLCHCCRHSPLSTRIIVSSFGRAPRLFLDLEPLLVLRLPLHVIYPFLAPIFPLPVLGLLFHFCLCSAQMLICGGCYQCIKYSISLLFSPFTTSHTFIPPSTISFRFPKLFTSISVHSVFLRDGDVPFSFGARLRYLSSVTAYGRTRFCSGSFFFRRVFSLDLVSFNVWFLLPSPLANPKASSAQTYRTYQHQHQFQN
ncbi:hypothetical protein DENSPDRAFT_184643 [Dentipellis sp. KUC8613]|nr:hypothetical protein DENSPDRAFT_184643 [Dentipellis sp. KUC8613]